CPRTVRRRWPRLGASFLVAAVAGAVERRLSLPRPSSFFLESDGERRDLHSFPTRRSSDLAGNTLSEGVMAEEGINSTAYHIGPRSEEHTSELQSRENLVCRLLLEKKNGHDGAAWRWA